MNGIDRNDTKNGVSSLIVIGKSVWLSSRFIVLPYVSIGDCAVVSKDVVPYTIDR